jgi:hypothetical protein
MKILITEKQAEKLFGEKIKCRCGHSWTKEKKDQHPYLCHMCGWDQKHEKYNDKELLNFWKKELGSN